ncbi:hypothetical protein VNO78_04282 [Psophocarpus tetragonolobus]|uniref:Wax synthase domain-containing protein n=1 Tax=Psophocarpus tetragonolobus TaxID=3891 RepID=A0AAN9T2B5_PSOTE
MEGEIKNLIMVWSVAAGTMCYCHRIGKVTKEGAWRVIAVLPAIIIVLVLPLRLTSIHLGGPTSFFLGWLSTFKLVLFAFGKGPLSRKPPLSLSHFVPIACLPIQFQHQNNTSGNSKITTKSPLQYASTSMVIIMAALIPLYGNRNYLHPKLLLFLYGLHMYIGLEFVLATVSAITCKFLGVQLEAHFDTPYLSTSLQDFWGKRWNIMVNRLLHPSVYHPVARLSARFIGTKWAPLPAVLASFAVSGMMHELVFYYIKREKRTWEAWEPSWDASCFFLIHGACVCVEVGVKKTLKGKKQWHLPRLLSCLLTFLFVQYTALTFFLPALVRCHVYDKAVREFTAFTHFLNDLYAVSLSHLPFANVTTI